MLKDASRTRSSGLSLGESEIAWELSSIPSQPEFRTRPALGILSGDQAAALSGTWKVPHMSRNPVIGLLLRT